MQKVTQVHSQRKELNPEVLHRAGSTELTDNLKCTPVGVANWH